MQAPRLPASVTDLGHGFFHLHGSFKLGSIVDIGTQASLVRRADGRFVMLDAIDLTPEVDRWIDAMTDGGTLLDAVLHVHPFHTVFVEKAHRRFPEAKLYGTVRHHRRLSSLPWRGELCEGEAIRELFADDLIFTVPRGVDFVPANEGLHFSSVIVVHPASRTMHVDDTLNYLPLPWPVRALKRDYLGFHPTLAKVLEPRAGAAADFRAWCGELVELARDVDHLCAAHHGVLRVDVDGGPPLADRIEAAARAVEGKLRAHERRHG